MLVRNHDEGVDRVLHLGDAGLRDPHAPAAFEMERLGDDPDGENAHLAGRPGDDGGCPGPGAAAHAGCKENHVRASELIAYLLQRLLRRRLADLGFRSGAEAFGHLKADLNNSVGAR